MNFKNTKNIEMVAEILKKQNIKNLIISPGGTNIPLVKLVQKDDFFTCYSIVDERSAVYFAIGIYLQTGNPVAMICTSAQATRNYIPGLTEAFYKKVPILAITMEKHPRFKYQDYMQAPDQTSLPNDSVKKSFELPFIKDINDIYHSKRLINDAILELTHNGKGPVQLCIPWLDFNILEIEPKNKIIKRVYISEMKKLNLDEKKILIAIGEHRPFTDEEKNSLNYFCKNTNSVVYTNHLSNFFSEYSVNGNLLLSTIDDKQFNKIKPDILITIGGQTGDYPFYLRFSKTEYSEIEHWRISEDGNIVDTYDKLTYAFQGSEKEFFTKVQENNVEHQYLNLWKDELNKLIKDVDVPFSNVSIANFLHDKIPENSIMQFSILNSLRVWNLFDLNPSIQCYSNVGAFGIDGGMSTLIGQSVASDKLSFMIIGDLAFFYDINSIGIRHIKNNLRILIINNNGGIEFKLNGDGDNNTIDQYIAAANHYKNAKGWAETCGFKYLSAKNMSEFISMSTEFIEPSNKPIIFEVFVSDKDESDAYQSMININKKKNEIIKKELKKSVKKVFGENTINKLKNKIGK